MPSHLKISVLIPQGFTRNFPETIWRQTVIYIHHKMNALEKDFESVRIQFKSMHCTEDSSSCLAYVLQKPHLNTLKRFSTWNSSTIHRSHLLHVVQYLQTLANPEFVKVSTEDSLKDILWRISSVPQSHRSSDTLSISYQQNRRHSLRVYNLTTSQKCLDTCCK